MCQGYNIVARRAYCVGEAPENHVCPFVRPCVRVRVRTFLDPVSELESEDTSAISLKKGTKKGPSGTFGSKSEMDLGQRVIQIL